VLTNDVALAYEVTKFRLFHLNLIRFLRVPLDAGENALRDAAKQSSVNLLANYLARAERVHVLRAGALQSTNDIQCVGSPATE
jgi:hypothetical protein